MDSTVAAVDSPLNDLSRICDNSITLIIKIHLTRGVRIELKLMLLLLHLFIWVEYHPLNSKDSSGL